jgi:hypothetical protein
MNRFYASIDDEYNLTLDSSFFLSSFANRGNYLCKAGAELIGVPIGLCT